MATVEPEEVEGHFKKESSEVIARRCSSHIPDLVASELVCFKAYRSINACQERPIKSAINACEDISLIQYKEQPTGEKQK